MSTWTRREEGLPWLWLLPRAPHPPRPICCHFICLASATSPPRDVSLLEHPACRADALIGLGVMKRSIDSHAMA